MKRASLMWRASVVCAGVFVCAQPCAQAQVYHPWLKESIAPPAREELVDDYLFELSKALPANCILDARRVDAQARVKPFPASTAAVVGKWSPSRLYVLDEFRDQASLVQQPLGDHGTLLFWRVPSDEEEIEAARLIARRRVADEELLVAAKTEGEEEQTPYAAQISSYKPLAARWAKYFQEAHGWDGQSNQVDISVKVADLPPDLRELVLAEVRYEVYGRMNLGFDVFGDEHWDAMRLVVDNSQRHTRTNRIIPYLSLWSPLMRTPIASRIGRLDVTPPAPEPKIGPRVQPVASDNTVPPAPLRSPDKFARILFPEEMEADAALQVKVSLEAKRRPLKSLVADLKKHGVALAVAGDAPFASAPVTLRVSEMPLWKMMASLSRIYGATWSKNGAAYSLRLAKLDPIDAALLPRSFSYRFFLRQMTIVEADARRQRDNDLARQIVRHVRPGQLNSPQGAPFSDVPQELRDQVRQSFQEDDAKRIIGGQVRLDATPLEGMVLRFARLNISRGDMTMWGSSATTGDTATMGAFTADGRLICRVFSKFGVGLSADEKLRRSLNSVPGFPPVPPDFKMGDPELPPPPRGWKLGDPVPTFPPGWKKGDPWPEWPKPGDNPAAPPQAAPNDALGGPQ